MYYPKSQITPDLYTNGKEFVYSNSEKEYIGFYFQTSDGKYFTGRNPNDPPVQEIKIPTDSRLDDAEEGTIGSYTEDTLLYLVPDVYANAQNMGIDDIPPSPPKQIISLPTEKNYKLGEYQRYFASKNNEIKFTEIDYDQYSKFINQESDVDYLLYTAFSFPWLIAGNRSNVINVNKKTVERIQDKLNLVGFTSYFIGKLDQYFKYTKNENLNTDGTEFLNSRTNKPYSGLYHIHPKKGPMVGAQHTTLPHDYLIPISGSNIDNRINKIETQRNNRMGGSY